ncbi:uncharacterized protein LOC144907419 isoform X1 [Branchiostoma floridae x Branchiostoma belcheri]
MNKVRQEHGYVRLLLILLTAVFFQSCFASVPDVTLVNMFQFSVKEEFTQMKCVSAEASSLSFGANEPFRYPSASFGPTAIRPETWGGQMVWFFAGAGADKAGVFNCKAVLPSGQEVKVSTVKMTQPATVLPKHFTITAHPGDTVNFYTQTNGSFTERIRWKKNGVVLHNMASAKVMTLYDVDQSDAGVYETFLDGREQERTHAIARLIVTRCPDGLWGPGCDQTCPKCYNGGVCHEDLGECICPPGFKGPTCETGCGGNSFGRDCQYECDANGLAAGCKERIFCLPDPYGCSCSPGYRNLLCSTPCLPGSFGAGCTQTCHCRSIGPNACDVYTGWCRDGCAKGWKGPSCQEEDIDHCDPDPCENGGACHGTEETYSCECPDGFEGQHCEIDLDECESWPCLNGGACFDVPGKYVCACVDGYTGTNCEEDIDECSSSPCQNNGVCVHGLDEFKCECLRGFFGPRCEVDLNECTSSPCRNNGTCVDLPGAYRCDCPHGIMGNNCEYDVLPCLSEPCLNGGNCSAFGDLYICFCAEGFYGRNCENELPGQSEGPTSGEAQNDALPIMHIVLAGVAGPVVLITLFLLYKFYEKLKNKNKTKQVDVKPKSSAEQDSVVPVESTNSSTNLLEPTNPLDVKKDQQFINTLQRPVANAGRPSFRPIQLVAAFPGAAQRPAITVSPLESTSQNNATLVTSLQDGGNNVSSLAVPTSSFRAQNSSHRPTSGHAITLPSVFAQRKPATAQTTPTETMVTDFNDDDFDDESESEFDDDVDEETVYS